VYVAVTRVERPPVKITDDFNIFGGVGGREPLGALGFHSSSRITVPVLRTPFLGVMSAVETRQISPVEGAVPLPPLACAIVTAAAMVLASGVFPNRGGPWIIAVNSVCRERIQSRAENWPTRPVTMSTKNMWS